MWSQTYDPVGGSLRLSALVAMLPVFVVLVVLGVFRKPAWVAAMSGFVTSAIVSVAAYHMPFSLAIISALTARLTASCPSAGLYSARSCFTGSPSRPASLKLSRIR